MRDWRNDQGAVALKPDETAIKKVVMLGSPMSAGATIEDFIESPHPVPAMSLPNLAATLQALRPNWST